MNSTATAVRHVHLDIELDPQNRFRYQSQGEDAYRVRLHRGDTLTCTCHDRFSLWFVKESPFNATKMAAHREVMRLSREWFLTAEVREDVPDGVYQYVVEINREGRVFQDGPEDTRIFRDDPEIVIETA